MRTVSRIVFCQCQNAGVLPGSAVAAARRGLESASHKWESINDLCALAAANDTRLNDWASTDGLRVVACHPRAIKWLFASAGLRLDPSKTEVVNLREKAPEQAAAAAGAVELKPNLSQSSAGAENQSFPDRHTGSVASWFPVVDYDRCTHCMQCLSFCLFGVFDVDAGRRLRVMNPESCKPLCPACSRVCPETAIIFPKYSGGPMSGAEVPPSSEGVRSKIDITALLGGNVYATLRDRRARTRQRFAADRDPDQALSERRRCMAELIDSGFIPAEVLASLPSREEIQRRAEEASARAKAALAKDTPA